MSDIQIMDSDELRKKKKESEQKATAILEMARRGISDKEIASATGESLGTIKHMRSFAGIQLARGARKFFDEWYEIPDGANPFTWLRRHITDFSEYKIVKVSESEFKIVLK